MHGYTASSYGDAFADVYDRWYGGLDDPGAITSSLSALVPPGTAVLELGVGTGRVAVPLARAVAGSGSVVHGIDSSARMLAVLAENDPDGLVVRHEGDMVDDMPAGPFGLVVAAYNTLFNLLSAERQAACFRAVAARLAGQGCFVVDAFVPATAEPGARVGVRSMGADHVVLSVSRADPGRQEAEGQYIEITEAGGVRLRPWAVRWATPAELDGAARAAGLRLAGRAGGYREEPFDEYSTRHVSVYRL